MNDRERLNQTMKKPLLLPIRDRAELILEAQALAQSYDLPFSQRGQQSLKKWQRIYGGPLLVLSAEGLAYHEGETRLHFHPGTSHLRRLMQEQGREVVMLSALALRPQDRVLDATLGLASDAQLILQQLNEAGSLVGLESSWPIYWVVKEGMRRLSLRTPGDAGKAADNDAAGTETERAHRGPQVAVLAVDHTAYLSAQEAKSFDVIYFDPMFRDSVAASVNLDPLRALADDSPLQAETVREACRVARRRVVMKERFGSEEFVRLGFRRVHSSRNGKVAYGVIDLA